MAENDEAEHMIEEHRTRPAADPADQARRAQALRATRAQVVAGLNELVRSQDWAGLRVAADRGQAIDGVLSSMGVPFRGPSVVPVDAPEPTDPTSEAGRRALQPAPPQE